MFRVDSIQSPTGADWQSAGGFGVNYGIFNRNKNGLTPGETYRGQSRTWCDLAGGMYKSSSWTPLLFWTQPTYVCLNGGVLQTWMSIQTHLGIFLIYHLFLIRLWIYRLDW